MVQVAFRDLPSVVIEKVRTHTLDTVGCELLGTLQPWSILVRGDALVESPVGPCTFVGTSRRGRPEWVALANATLAHGFEADDGHLGAQLHPGTASVPTAFAVAEELDSDDESVILAIALGMEL